MRPKEMNDLLGNAQLIEVGGRFGYQFDVVPDLLAPSFGAAQDQYMQIAGKWWVNERRIPHRLRPWRPFRETVPVTPDGKADSDVLKGTERFFANSHYLVFTRVLEANDPTEPNGLHLSMRTVENDTRHDWREMQRVKNELAGPDWEAMELYPAEERVVDTANQYHLWCVPYRIGMGFNTRFVRDADDPLSGGAVQRPHVPGTPLTDDATTKGMLDSWSDR